MRGENQTGTKTLVGGLLSPHGALNEGAWWLWECVQKRARERSVQNGQMLWVV